MCFPGSYLDEGEEQDEEGGEGEGERRGRVGPAKVGSQAGQGGWGGGIVSGDKGIVGSQEPL